MERLKSFCFNFYLLLAIIFAIGAVSAYASLCFFATVKIIEKLGFIGDTPVILGYVSAASGAAYSLSTKAVATCDIFPKKLEKLFSNIWKTFRHPLEMLKESCEHFRRRSCAAIVLEDLFGTFGVLSTSINAFFTGLGSSLGIDLLASTHTSLLPFVVGISIYIGIASFITNTAFGAPISSENLKRLANAVIRKCCSDVCEVDEEKPLLSQASILTVLRQFNGSFDKKKDLELGLDGLTPDETREYQEFVPRFKKVVLFWREQHLVDEGQGFASYRFNHSTT